MGLDSEVWAQWDLPDGPVDMPGPPHEPGLVSVAFGQLKKIPLGSVGLKSSSGKKLIHAPKITCSV